MADLKLPEAPARLFDENGRLNCGNFLGPVSNINIKDFDYKGLRRWPWTLTNNLASKLLKRWQFVGVMDENIVFGAAVVHLNYVGSGFAYVYDKRTGKLTEVNIKMPLAAGTEYSKSPDSGTSQIRKGSKLIRMDNTTKNGERRLTLDFGPKLRANIVYAEPGIGISTSAPQSMFGYGYTYKTAGLPAKGELTINGENYTLDEDALGLLDWSAATAPRVTVWNWAAGMGKDKDGHIIGINFSTGLIAAAYTENTVWLDGVPYMVDGVHFDYNQKDILGQPWKLYSVDKAVDLVFHPDHERYENVNFGFAASSLHQPFGQFEGTIRFGNKKLDVSTYGFCEQHYAKW